VRGIREDTNGAYDHAITRWARADDAWQGITWTIARDPIGESIPLNESGTLRVLTSEGARSIDLPTLTVIYEYDDHYVTIKDARFTDAKASFASRA
jgi:hypothetical protein